MHPQTGRSVVLLAVHAVSSAWRWRLGAVSVLKARWHRMAAPHHHSTASAVWRCGNFIDLNSVMSWGCHKDESWFQHLSRGTLARKPSWESVGSHKPQCAFQNKFNKEFIQLNKMSHCLRGSPPLIRNYGDVRHCCIKRAAHPRRVVNLARTQRPN